MKALKPWFIALAAFYCVWLVLVVTGNHWGTLADHWGISLAMALGSYAAGSTPMGGGTVGFPVLVLLFNEAPTLGRDFSFAIQSIGMTSASVFILCRKQPIEWPMLRWCLLGSFIGTPLGILFVAPLVSGLIIKVLFAVVWCSFGVLHLYRLREIVQHEGLSPGAHRFDRNAGFLVGLLAGMTAASITGVGIDMVLYAVLVLLCQADLKIAIPTSVLIMAFTSLVGISTKFLFDHVQPGVYENWLAAAPVVALGAPLGAFIVHKIGRTSTLFVVSILCVGQFFWTVQNEWSRLGILGASAAMGGVLLFNLGFEWLHRIGSRVDRRKKRNHS
ncbi:MAG: sulfite exporter TauE/SafE family protein [Verrucomicrobia bacterium]|nr:sulfite exporter TauE/SafE family protein [Verrucomicrobiota bacterium]MDA1068632.1 sulfite exporter TauE/SafE family protein [Verrucomicrobiota bacterium]